MSSSLYHVHAVPILPGARGWPELNKQGKHKDPLIYAPWRKRNGWEMGRLVRGINVEQNTHDQSSRSRKALRHQKCRIFIWHSVVDLWSYGSHIGSQVPISGHVSSSPLSFESPLVASSVLIIPFRPIRLPTHTHASAQPGLGTQRWIDSFPSFLSFVIKLEYVKLFNLFLVLPWLLVANH